MADKTRLLHLPAAVMATAATVARDMAVAAAAAMTMEAKIRHSRLPAVADTVVPDTDTPS